MTTKHLEIKDQGKDEVKLTEEEDGLEIFRLRKMVAREFTELYQQTFRDELGVSKPRDLLMPQIEKYLSKVPAEQVNEFQQNLDSYYLLVSELRGKQVAFREATLSNVPAHIFEKVRDLVHEKAPLIKARWRDVLMEGFQNRRTEGGVKGVVDHVKKGVGKAFENVKERFKAQRELSKLLDPYVEESNAIKLHIQDIEANVSTREQAESSLATTRHLFDRLKARLFFEFEAGREVFRDAREASKKSIEPLIAKDPSELSTLSLEILSREFKEKSKDSWAPFEELETSAGVKSPEAIKADVGAYLAADINTALNNALDNVSLKNKEKAEKEMIDIITNISKSSTKGGAFFLKLLQKKIDDPDTDKRQKQVLNKALNLLRFEIWR